MLHWLRLAEDDRRRLHARAAAARLPAELWLRIAVEASRVVGEIEGLTGYGRETITATLDVAASEPRGDRVEPLDGGALRRYGEGLQRGTATSAPTEELALRLSEEIAAGWGHAAAAERAALPTWIAKQLESAPRHCVQWEAAAARGGRTLAEWAYASFLRWSALSTASAQRSI